MADEWMELGRIAINDLVKNRRAERTTQRGGQSSRGRHSHRGRSPLSLSTTWGQHNHQINVDRAAFYRRQRQFDELPAYVDHRRRSRSPPAPRIAMLIVLLLVGDALDTCPCRVSLFD